MFQGALQGQARVTVHTPPPQEKPKKAVARTPAFQKDPKEVIPFHQEGEEAEEVLKDF